jgi:hypothetical protein
MSKIATIYSASWKQLNKKPKKKATNKQKAAFW